MAMAGKSFITIFFYCRQIEIVRELCNREGMDFPGQSGRVSLNDTSV